MRRIPITLTLIVLCTLSLLGCSTTGTQQPKVKRNVVAAGYNVQLGIGYLREGYVNRAKEKLLIALQQAPEWGPAYDAMGLFLEKTGQNEQAETYFKRAIALDPKRGSVHNNYGTYLCRRDQYQEAIEQFHLAVADPQYINDAEAYENAGLCAMKIPDKIIAKTNFEKALQQDPRRAQSLLFLAQLSFEADKPRIAQAYLKRYRQLAKPSAESLWLSIQVAHRLDDNDTVGNDALLLRNKFSVSKQYQLYKKSGIA